MPGKIRICKPIFKFHRFIFIENKDRYGFVGVQCRGLRGGLHRVMRSYGQDFSGVPILRFRSVLAEWNRLGPSKPKTEFDVANLLPNCLARLTLFRTIAHPNAHGVDFVTQIMGEHSAEECERLGVGVRAGALMEVDSERDFMFNGYLKAATDKRPVGLCAQYVTIDGLRRKCIKICLPLDLEADVAGWVLLCTDFLEPNVVHSEDRMVFVFCPPRSGPPIGLDLTRF